MLTYEEFKVLHILGVVLFPRQHHRDRVWKYRAGLTSRLKVIACTQRLVTLADFIFTLAASF